MSKIIINVVALFDESSTKTMLELMNQLAKISNNSDALRFPPHFTLRYDFEIEDVDFDKMADRIQKAATGLQLPAEIEGYKISYTPWNCVWLEIKVPDAIKKLHEEIMEIGQKYRTEFVDPVLLLEKSFDEKQKEYVQKYGYHLAFEYYSPHVTIAGGKIEQQYLDEVKKFNIELPIEGTVDKIAFLKKEHDGSRSIHSVLNI